MFRERFKPPKVNFGKIYLPELSEVSDDSGNKKVEIVRVCQSKELPDMENFKLKNQLAAGVDLKVVPTVLIPADSCPVPPDFIPQDNPEKQEQTNKQEQQQKQ